MSPSHASRNISRVEAFSDAVFAFAATLLVVSLEVPTTFPELMTDLRGFLAFGLSFLGLILIWSVHRAFFRRYELRDPLTVALNSCLLFVVLFYIYPMKFLADLLGAMVLGDEARQAGMRSWDDLATLFMLYSGGFVAIFLCVALLYRHAYGRREELGLDVGQQEEARTLSRHYLILVLVGLFSILVAWSQVGLIFGLPGLVYMLLGPLCFWHARWSEARSSALGLQAHGPEE